MSKRSSGGKPKKRASRKSRQYSPSPSRGGFRS